MDQGLAERDVAGAGWILLNQLTLSLQEICTVKESLISISRFRRGALSPPPNRYLSTSLRREPVRAAGATQNGAGSSARGALYPIQFVPRTELISPLQLDLSFSYDPSDLKNLTSAQLTVLASSLHSERVDPFVVAEARTLFTTRRGNELGAEFVTREALKGEWR